MRRNKRIKKHSRFATSSMGIASLIISGFIMMMIFFAMNAKCSSIAREIGQKERELQHLEEELMREQGKWDEMKVPDRLKTALTRFGLEMDVPRPDQLVRMSSAGRPVPGQLALVRLRGATMAAPTSVARLPPRRVAGVSSGARRQGRNGVRK